MRIRKTRQAMWTRGFFAHDREPGEARDTGMELSSGVPGLSVSLLFSFINILQNACHNRAN